MRLKEYAKRMMLLTILLLMLTSCVTTQTTTDVSCDVFSELSYTCMVPKNNDSGTLEFCLGDNDDTAWTVKRIIEHNEKYRGIGC